MGFNPRVHRASVRLQSARASWTDLPTRNFQGASHLSRIDFRTGTAARVPPLRGGPGARCVAFLALRLGKSLFLEGEAGVGNTSLAAAAASALEADFIRLQCYEGLDVAHAVYEWD